jgi:hypothetical protein
MKKLLAFIIAFGILLAGGTSLAVSADVNPDYADLPQYVTPPQG